MRGRLGDYERQAAAVKDRGQSQEARLVSDTPAPCCSGAVSRQERALDGYPTPLHLDDRRDEA